jgi:hypothetical protein
MQTFERTTPSYFNRNFQRGAASSMLGVDEPTEIGIGSIGHLALAFQ